MLSLILATLAFASSALAHTPVTYDIIYRDGDFRRVRDVRVLVDGDAATILVQGEPLTFWRKGLALTPCGGTFDSSLVTAEAGESREYTLVLEDLARCGLPARITITKAALYDVGVSTLKAQAKP